jgi:rhamnogalacturonyl hydrolase YesR
MQYTVIEHTILKELIETVNALGRAGWVPAGGLCVSDGKFYQAMMSMGQVHITSPL